MTREEAKTAFRAGTPVMFGGVRYRGITALIYRRNAAGGLTLQVELLDQNRRAVVIAQPERVEIAKEEATT